MTDDQGWGDLSLHGNDSISTPHIDAFANESVRFNRFYVSPVCAPTRASLLTGRYHLRTGASWVTHRKEVMRKEEITIAELFKFSGYATGCFGKWHNGSQYPNDPLGQGFEEFYGFASGHWNNYFNTTLTHNQNTVQSKGFITDVITDKAIDFIKEKNNQAQPFLCYVPYNAPHGPFQVPDKYFDKYKNMGLTDKNAAVYGMVENIDDNVGRMLSTLKELNISENTIIIFLTDNGPNGRRFNGGMRGTKASVHEGGVRVPFFLKYGAHFKKNQIVTQIASHIDVLPTLAELCNVAFPLEHEMDGRSLVPLLKNKKPNWTDRQIFSIQNNGQNKIFPSSVRTNQYRLVIDRNENTLLFDMQKDPGEQNNISEKFPEITNQLKTDLENWYEEVSENAYEPELVEVGNFENIPTILSAPESKLKGAIKFKGGFGWANDYIIDWKNKFDQATWKMNVVQNGLYSIEVKYDCSEDFVPAEFQLESSGIDFTFSFKEAGNIDFLPSPDRIVRGEVYEKNWMQLKIGSFDLKKGIHDLSFILNTNKSKGWLEFKEIEIKRTL